MHVLQVPELPERIGEERTLRSGESLFEIFCVRQNGMLQTFFGSLSGSERKPFPFTALFPVSSFFERARTGTGRLHSPGSKDFLPPGQEGGHEVFQRFYEIGSYAGLAELEVLLQSGTPL